MTLVTVFTVIFLAWLRLMVEMYCDSSTGSSDAGLSSNRSMCILEGFPVTIACKQTIRTA